MLQLKVGDNEGGNGEENSQNTEGNRLNGV